MMKLKLLHSEEELFYTQTELLNFKLTLPLAKLAMVEARLTSNGLIFSSDTPIDIQLVTFLFLSHTNELSIGEKTKTFDNHCCL